MAASIRCRSCGRDRSDEELVNAEGEVPCPDCGSLSVAYAAREPEPEPDPRLAGLAALVDGGHESAGTLEVDLPDPPPATSVGQHHDACGYAYGSPGCVETHAREQRPWDTSGLVGRMSADACERCGRPHCVYELADQTS